MFGGNCLPQVRMCGFFSIQQAFLGHVPWSGLQTHRSWVEMRVHSKMGEPGFEHGLEGERDRQGVHLQQAVGEAEKQMQRRKIFFRAGENC